MTTAAPSPPTTDTLVISEVFGPTLQGEGPSTGRHAGFIRLGGCNLSCSWCDTKYTWDARSYDLRTELTRQPVTDITERATRGNPGLVVITGGEPLLHQYQPGWSQLLSYLDRNGYDIEIETNGTITPTGATLSYGPRFNVSPKLTHSGDSPEDRIRPDVLDRLATRCDAIFKFVCATPADVVETAALTDTHGIPRRSVWISPRGTTRDSVLDTQATLAETTVDHGFNLGTRLHVLLWGDERGR